MPILTGNFGLLIMCMIVSAVLASGMGPPLRMLRVAQFFCREVRRRVAANRRARRARMGLPPVYPWSTSPPKPANLPALDVFAPSVDPVPSTSAISPAEAQAVECPPECTPETTPLTSSISSPQPSTSGILRAPKTAATTSPKPSTSGRRVNRKATTGLRSTGGIRKKSEVTSPKPSTSGIRRTPRTARTSSPRASTSGIRSTPRSVGTESPIPSTSGVPAMTSGPSTQRTPGSDEQGTPTPSTSTAAGEHGDTTQASRKRPRRDSSDDSGSPSPRRPRREQRSKSRTPSESDTSSSTPGRSPSIRKQRRQ